MGLERLESHQAKVGDHEPGQRGIRALHDPSSAAKYLKSLSTCSASRGLLSSRCMAQLIRLARYGKIRGISKRQSKFVRGLISAFSTH